MGSSAEEIREFLQSRDGTGVTLRELVSTVGCTPTNAATLLKGWAEIGCIRVEGGKRSRCYIWTGEEFPSGRGGKIGRVHHTDCKGLMADLTFGVLREAQKPLSLDQIADKVRSRYFALGERRRRFYSKTDFKPVVRTTLRRWQRDGYVIISFFGDEELFQLVHGVEERPPVRAKAFPEFG